VKRITRVIIATATAVGLLLVGTNFASAAPPGWNGTIKTHEGATEPTPVTRDDPQVCTFHLHGFNFDPEQEIDWWINKTGSPVLTGKILTTTEGAFVSTEYSLSDGSYRLYWASPIFVGAKHKNFKVSCQPTPSASPSVSPSTSPSASPVSSPTPRPTPSIGTVPTPDPSTSPSPSPIPSLTTSPDPSTPTGSLPPTDTEDAAEFALNAVGIYLIACGIVLVFVVVGWITLIRR
jgi:hypothetical protein